MVVVVRPQLGRRHKGGCGGGGGVATLPSKGASNSRCYPRLPTTTPMNRLPISGLTLLAPVVRVPFRSRAQPAHPAWPLTQLAAPLFHPRESLARRRCCQLVGPASARRSGSCESVRQECVPPLAPSPSRRPSRAAPAQLSRYVAKKPPSARRCGGSFKTRKTRGVANKDKGRCGRVFSPWHVRLGLE